MQTDVASTQDSKLAESSTQLTRFSVVQCRMDPLLLASKQPDVADELPHGGHGCVAQTSRPKRHLLSAESLAQQAAWSSSRASLGPSSTASAVLAWASSLTAAVS